MEKRGENSQGDDLESQTSYRKKLFLDIFVKARGIVSIVCEKLNIPRSTYSHWRKTDPEFRKAVDFIIREKPKILDDRLFTLYSLNPTKDNLY